MQSVVDRRRKEQLCYATASTSALLFKKKKKIKSKILPGPGGRSKSKCRSWMSST